MPLTQLKRLISSPGHDDEAPDTMVLDGRILPVRYRRNARARRIIMRMDKQAQGIVLTVPEGTSFTRALEFAHSQSGWIWQRLEPELPGGTADLHGIAITIRGVEHLIEVSEQSRGVPVHIQDLPAPTLKVRGAREHMPRRIIDFMKREARTDLERASNSYAMAMGTSYKTLTVRDTTSRWGSCSSTGTLSYSWRLIMAPPRVLDYVAAHEVAHLLEMNHGPDFWALVYDNCPHTDWARRWLRKNGQTLHKLPI